MTGQHVLGDEEGRRERADWERALGGGCDRSGFITGNTKDGEEWSEGEAEELKIFCKIT